MNRQREGNHLLCIGIIGTVLTALCCFTPVLVVPRALWGAGVGGFGGLPGLCAIPFARGVPAFGCSGVVPEKPLATRQGMSTASRFLVRDVPQQSLKRAHRS